MLAELKRGIGLAAHDVGVGAYVYLRRVFENLLEEAHQGCANSDDWDEEEYLRSRVAERVMLLKDSLPTFLVDNPQIYALLSKGIHELSEQDCLRHFEVLKVAIELILDEKLEAKQKLTKIAEAKKALAEIVSNVNTTKA